VAHIQRSLFGSFSSEKELLALGRSRVRSGDGVAGARAGCGTEMI
jgi:hypothetical protein